MTFNWSKNPFLIDLINSVIVIGLFHILELKLTAS